MMGNGLALVRRFRTFNEMRTWVDQCVRAGIVRCLSPERARGETCTSPATHVYYQDEAEWYPCCESHRIRDPQWSGHTKVRGGLEIALPVIPHKAYAWLSTLSETEQAQIRQMEYGR